ncbi:unnamed protein product [Parascedosporium putredinis]|uniref:Cytochrome P450 n=1 Tax=Parascedosporium putredinis TaxID=1442378 RepID=A0A9P1H4Q6_9PEZI|nr:unnamed protein product [Parascedosporium putredinis]CAI7997006.1 unnamed protein product [Parascedosporium putredinis]
MSQPIPQPPGVPLLGNIFDVDPSNTWTSLKKLAEKYGEIFQISVLGHKLVFVAGAALAEELCDEKRFRKFVGGPIVEIRAAAVADTFVDMRDTASELTRNWAGLGSGKNTIQLIEQLNRLNLEATTLALYGKKLNGLTGPPHPMLQAMEDSTSEAMKRPNRPGFLNRFFYGGKFTKSIRTMRGYAADVVENRKANPGDHARKDVLAALMNSSDPETGKALTESQVIDEIVSMPIGSSTAPCCVTTAIYFLLKNPDKLAEARKEVDTVLGKGEEFTYAHLSQLNYVEAIVRETLRLSFAAPGFNIEPIPNPNDKSPIKLGGGRYEIAHNQAMIIVLAGVNRDPTLPLGVRRFYGNGKRECIGKHYAARWNVVALATLLRDVDFEMADPQYELHQDGWFNLRPVDFFVKVKPRQA